MKKNLIKSTMGTLSLMLLVITLAGCSTTPGKYAPYVSAKNGNLNSVKEYIEAGGYINKRSSISGNDHTLLWMAAKNGHMDIVQYLVEKGADVNAMGTRRNGDGSYSSPRSIALLNGHRKVAEYLAKHGGEIRAR